MTTLDSASLKYWELVADWGTKLVIIGVAGEGVELLVKCFESSLKKKQQWRHFFHKADPWINTVGGIFWIMVVLGLWAEFRGNHMAKVILDKDNAELHDRATSNEREVARLNLEALKIKSAMTNRVISDFTAWEIAENLSASAATNGMTTGIGMAEVIVISIGSREPENLATQISLIFGKRDVSTNDTRLEAFKSKIPNGVTVETLNLEKIPKGGYGVYSPEELTTARHCKALASDLVNELNKRGITARRSNIFQDFAPTIGESTWFFKPRMIVVWVGERWP